MGESMPVSVSTLVFAAIVAILLFGAFLNRAVRLALKTWWSSLKLLPFDRRDEAELFPHREGKKAAKEWRSPRRTRPRIEKKATPIHRQG